MVNPESQRPKDPPSSSSPALAPRPTAGTDCKVVHRPSSTVHRPPSIVHRPSAAEPVTQLRRVKIVECGEELVDFLEACPGLLLDAPRFQYRRETLLRRTVAE